MNSYFARVLLKRLVLFYGVETNKPDWTVGFTCHLLVTKDFIWLKFSANYV